ncbi:methionyl-tRNA formyltransferase [Candidatus Saccharibacteria bacterium]|nr:methionyl-tRNA formyltransferase [Candidatus Saccharibacteria bacterium]
MSKTSKAMPNSGAKPRIVFFGNERIASGVTTTCPVLQKLIDEGYEVLAIVVNQGTNTSRRARMLEIADLAERYEIPVFSPAKPADISEKLSALGADVGVLVAYGRLVPQEVIDIFPAGIVNLHPSLLPLHRGSAPIESAILDGERVTGVSLMKVAKEMDAGDVYAYSEFELTGGETKQQLADELLELGGEMLAATLLRIVNGDIVGKAQDDSMATYDSHISKVDSLIDLTKPAKQLEREIRAYAGWPGSRTTIAGKDVVITAAHLDNNRLENVDNKSTFVANKQLCLQTSDGVLIIDRLKPAGKTEMPADAFLAGYGQRL